MTFLLIGIDDRYFEGLAGRLGWAVQEHLAERPSNQVFIKGSREEIARFLAKDEQPSPPGDEARKDEIAKRAAEDFFAGLITVSEAHPVAVKFRRVLAQALSDYESKAGRK